MKTHRPSPVAKPWSVYVQDLPKLFYAPRFAMKGYASVVTENVSMISIFGSDVSLACTRPSFRYTYIDDEDEDDDNNNMTRHTHVLTPTLR